MEKKQLLTSADYPLNVDADGLIHPTTGAEAPDGERWNDFYDRAGDEVLREVQAGQPIRIGESNTTDGGDTHFQSIVHIPVRTAPGVPTTLENLQTSLRTGLVGIDVDEIHSAVLPCPVNPDESEVDTGELAETVIHDLLQYPPAHLNEIILADPSTDWIDHLNQALNS